MAGEPILVARNCAFVVVDEPFSHNCREGSIGRISNQVFLNYAQAIDAPILQLAEDTNFLLDEQLTSKIADLGRRTLILAGGLLEGAITQIALSSLLDGYDVYVCADRLVTGDPGREETYLDRIRYCAGHIVTTRQIILELLSQEKDEAARAPLEALLA